MNRCKTCRHWQRWGNSKEGKCKLIQTNEDGYTPAQGHRTVKDPDAQASIWAQELPGWLETLETFSCVLWNDGTAKIVSGENHPEQSGTIQIVLHEMTAENLALAITGDPTSTPVNLTTNGDTPKTIKLNISGPPEFANELGHRIYQLLSDGIIFPSGNPGASARLTIQGDLLRSYDGVDDPGVSVEITVE